MVVPVEMASLKDLHSKCFCRVRLPLLEGVDGHGRIFLPSVDGDGGVQGSLRAVAVILQDSDIRPKYRK